MKTALKTAVTLIAIASAFGCTYDDADIRQKMDEMDGRITELEQVVKDINSNISALMTAVSALENNDRIESVTPLEDGSGYEIVFSNSGTITVKHGETPAISVKQYEDGEFYWTLDGEYLLDESGNRIPATSDTAVPQIRINGDNFELSFDGEHWQTIGSAGGAGLFKDVQDGADAVTFVLSDDTTIVIPKVQQFALSVSKTEVPVTAGTMAYVKYTITAADEGTQIAGFGTDGLEIYSIQPDIASDISRGSVLVNIPDPVPSKGKVYLFAVNSKGTTSARIISFEKGEFSADVMGNEVPAEGGTVRVMVFTNYDYVVDIPSDAASWISLVDTKAVESEIVKLTIAENTSTEPRSATISITDGAVTVFQSFTITQAGAEKEDPGPEPVDGYSGTIEDWQDDGSLDF